MSKELDLSVPEAETGTKKSPMKWIYILIALLLIVAIFNTVFLLKGREAININTGPCLEREEIKQLAMKLEKQSLDQKAVEAWKEYLSVSGRDDVESAKIWYRIGKIYQTNGDYDNALDAYYRSESFSKPDDIKDEISRCIQESLEAAGKFAALRYELDERVGEGDKNAGTSGGQIVAEIGQYRITREELDKKIEKLIESRIRGLSRYLSPDRINMEKENLLKQYSSENGRGTFLEQYIIEEILYRKAREERLADSQEVRDALKDVERDFLVSRVLENTYTNEIKISETDIKNYYEANKGKYIKKEEDGKERELAFDEVKARVMLDLMSEKEKEVQKNLILQLRQKYNVVVHSSALSSDESTENK